MATELFTIAEEVEKEYLRKAAQQPEEKEKEEEKKRKEKEKKEKKEKIIVGEDPCMVVGSVTASPVMVPPLQLSLSTPVPVVRGKLSLKKRSSMEPAAAPPVITTPPTPAPSRPMLPPAPVEACPGTYVSYLRVFTLGLTVRSFQSYRFPTTSLTTGRSEP
jgi:hypothetical protein